MPALRLLLKRFSGYLGSNDLLETPPDYMFVDWIFRTVVFAVRWERILKKKEAGSPEAA